MLEASLGGYPPIVTTEPVKEMNVGDKWDRSVMRVNQKHWVLLKNIKTNIKKGFPQLQPANPQPDVHLAIVGGGWTLNDPEVYEELRDLYFNGVKLVALNGAGNWLMERNLRPSMQIVLDSRPENISFIKNPIPKCRYLLASQCDPSLFDICSDRDTTMFHLHNESDENQVKPDPIPRRLDSFYLQRWTKVPSAGTVGVVAPMLCRILGFEFFHLFGYDSCYSPDDKHHAYEQPLNDNDGCVPFITKSGKVFTCSAWQASQVGSFVEMIEAYGNLFHFQIHGNGLLAQLINEEI